MPHDAELPIDPDAATAVRAGDRQWDVALVVAAGGALGGAARFAVNQLWPPAPDGFPVATFVENVSGCLLLGALTVFLFDVWRPTRYARPFLAVGVLGGYTTFSAYAADTHRLVVAGDVGLAAGYASATVLLGLLATWAGMTLARAASRRGRSPGAPG